MMGAMSTVDFASRIALIHSLVKPEEVENGIAVAATLTNLARVIGPAVAGVLIAYAGVAGAFALNGLSFFAVLIALALMRIPQQPVPAHSSSLRADLIEGGLHVLRDRTIMVMLALIMTVSFLVLNYQTILPVFARDILESGPLGLGLLTSAAGAGAVIGALILASRPPQSSLPAPGTRRRHFNRAGTGNGSIRLFQGLGTLGGFAGILERRRGCSAGQRLYLCASPDRGSAARAYRQYPATGHVFEPAGRGSVRRRCRRAIHSARQHGVCRVDLPNRQSDRAGVHPALVEDSPS